jgi:hypothetical protein
LSDIKSGAKDRHWDRHDERRHWSARSAIEMAIDLEPSRVGTDCQALDPLHRSCPFQETDPKSRQEMILATLQQRLFEEVDSAEQRVGDTQLVGGPAAQHCVLVHPGSRP